MGPRFLPPLFIVALALLGLIALLATLQYKWLGQISESDRERTRTALATGASEFAADFDRELAHAYLLFQPEAPEDLDEAQLAERFAARYDRWQASARFPRLLKDVYLVSIGEGRRLRRFNANERRFEATDWPASMANWREQLSVELSVSEVESGKSMFIRRMPPGIWERVPAIVVPTPMLFMADSRPDVQLTTGLSYAILAIDLDYVSRDLLPSLAERHFSRAGPADYQVAVVSRDEKGKVIFQSTPGFSPSLEGPADASADLLQVRPQDFTTLASEVRRFTAFVTAMHGAPDATAGPRLKITENRPFSFVVRPGHGRGIRGGTVVAPGSPVSGRSTNMTTTTRVLTKTSEPHWKLMVTHRSGSLETAVNAARRRNLLISSSILGVLGASVGLLVLTTRRAQRLAKQQMEFVAGVSHELRTPLAVIRSAAENLADGVVQDEEQIRRYGDLMRTEGRRLTDMVEQILEFAGIQSGQRAFALRAVAIEPLLRDIVSASASLIERAGVTVEFDLPADLPAVLGDEAALRRVFQNLIDNAIKYGAAGRWIGFRARKTGSVVTVTVADRGIGIDPAEQPRIFEPFYRAAAVIAAQMQGAGLGLSLVQRIVVAHGGRVTVTSAPGAGSEFNVGLPAAGEEAGDRQVDAVPSGVAST
jgi:signal transduction histidine kinase